MAIELIVAPHDVAELDVQSAAPVEWGRSEYVRVIESEAPEYDGTYEVTPTDAAQTLQTAHRLLRQDVTVNKVPYFETGNDSGGVTVSILS